MTITSNSILIVCTTFNFPNELSKTMACLLNVLNHRDDTFCTIIDNFSKNKETHEILNNTHHDRLTVIKNQINNGKAIATNAYLSETLTSKNCPRILVSMDPDVVFDTQSFNYFISALDSIPNLGMLAMRYIDNGFNPERSVWWPSKQIKGKGAAFNIRRPVFANVPGGFFGIQGYILNYYLNFKLFPKTKNEENIKKGFVRRAGSDDAFLYDFLKQFGLIQGFLEGTKIEHLKEMPQTNNYIT